MAPLPELLSEKIALREGALQSVKKGLNWVGPSSASTGLLERGRRFPLKFLARLQARPRHVFEG